MQSLALTQSTLFLRIGLCLTAMATVLLELLLTRMFSAAAGYHFAFMIVSITMFGMTFGALATLVKVTPNVEALPRTLVIHAYLFAASTIFVFYIFNAFNQSMLQAGPLIWITTSFLIFSIPFYFSGVCVCLCLSRFQDTGRLYGADLIGAGLSCPLLVMGLTLTDSQNILTFAGLLATFAGLCFVTDVRVDNRRRNYFYGVIVVILCGLSFMLPRFLTNIHVNEPIECVKWSPIGRVVVTASKGSARTWAHVAINNSPAVDQKGIYIDFGAFTVMTSGLATTSQLEPIKHDITAVGNILRPGKSIFVIGVGGGRDVLTGLLYGQHEIDGVEVNPAIVNMLTSKYAKFLGNLANRPGVRIINDEARNWLARSNKKYGLIQCSLVDTWSASSSGAFMLTENVLYTKEAFKLYLKHLEPDGILSFLRWGDRNEPAQILRMLTLARYALSTVGITDIGKHIMLIGAPDNSGKHTIADMLVSVEPFCDLDILRIKQVAQAEGYQLMWVPSVVAQEPFASLICNQNKIDPCMPSDDCPFFFTPINSSKNESSLAEPAQGKGLVLLFFTLFLTFILTGLTIVIPTLTRLKSKLGSHQNFVLPALFFGGLGLAFMQVEVGQIERLTVLLGNPTYSLSVVLFALLLASGIGSYIVEILLNKGRDPIFLIKLGLLSCFVLVTISALLSLVLLSVLAAAQTNERVIVAIVLVSIPAFFMGWGFPLGMKIYTKDCPEVGAWFWAVNGATSVLGSVLAAIISVIFGITSTLLFGAICYLIVWAVTLFSFKAHRLLT